MERVGSAVWQGGLKAGSGTLSTGSGGLSEVPYAFAMRFENEPGTNPEELIGAAHAGCFSMALSGKLAEAGATAERIETKARVRLEKIEAGWTVTAVHLEVQAKVPDADRPKFEQAATAAKEGCPISRLLGPGVPITMNARLV